MSTSKGSTGVTKNVLTFPQMFALTKWVEANQLQLTRKRPEDIATEATTALGFVVSASNVRSAYDTCGLELTFLRRRKGTSSSARTDRVYIVACELVKFLQALGHPVSPDLLAVSRRQPVKDQ